MTFGEHLEELRACLFKAIAGLMVGVLIGLWPFGKWTVDALKRPLERALSTYYQTSAEQDYAAWAAEELAAGRALPYTQDQIKEMVQERGLIFEMRYVDARLVRALVNGKPADPFNLPSDTPQTASASVGDTPAAAAYTSNLTPNEKLQRLGMQPLFLWQPIADDYRVAIKGLSSQEAFTIWMKAAFVVGLVLSSPWVFYQIWSFVAAGLYPHEKKYVHIFLPFSLGLFLAGALLAYLFVFDPVLGFLFSFNRWLGIEIDPRISEWLSFVLFLPIGFGISFQLPLVMLFLERIGVFNVTTYMTNWRIAILVIFVLSAVLTPADPYSMLLMAIPLTVLYFGGVLLCHWWPRQESPLDA